MCPQTEPTDAEIEADIVRDIGATSICRSVPEQARRIGVSKSFLFEEIRIGRLPSFKVGRRRLISDADVQSYLAARRQRAA